GSCRRARRRPAPGLGRGGAPSSRDRNYPALSFDLEAGDGCASGVEHVTVVSLVLVSRQAPVELQTRTRRGRYSSPRFHAANCASSSSAASVETSSSRSVPVRRIVSLNCATYSPQFVQASMG